MRGLDLQHEGLCKRSAVAQGGVRLCGSLPGDFLLTRYLCVQVPYLICPCTELYTQVWIPISISLSLSLSLSPTVLRSPLSTPPPTSIILCTDRRTPRPDGVTGRSRELRDAVAGPTGWGPEQ